MSSHHAPRYCFAHLWWVAAAGEITAQFTTGEYYAFDGFVQSDWDGFVDYLDNLGGFGSAANTGWPQMFDSLGFAKVAGPPLIYDDDHIGYNPAFPPTP